MRIPSFKTYRRPDFVAIRLFWRAFLQILSGNPYRYGIFPYKTIILD